MCKEGWGDWKMLTYEDPSFHPVAEVERPKKNCTELALPLHTCSVRKGWS